MNCKVNNKCFNDEISEFHHFHFNNDEVGERKSMDDMINTQGRNFIALCERAN